MRTCLYREIGGSHDPLGILFDPFLCARVCTGRLVVVTIEFEISLRGGIGAQGVSEPIGSAARHLSLITYHVGGMWTREPTCVWGKSLLGHSRGAQRGCGLHVRRWVTLLDPLFLGSRVEVVVPWEGCATSWYCVCNAPRA